MATTYYVGNIEVTSEDGRRARDPSQQKALDRYWKRRDGRPKKEKKSKVPTNKVEAAQTAVKALGFFQKFKTIGIILLILLIILLVVFVYLSNVYVDPNYLNVNAYMNKTYSRDTTFKIIMDEKNFIEARDTLSDAAMNSHSNDIAYTGELKSVTGLSDERFSTEYGFISGYTDINEMLLAVVDEYGSFSVTSNNETFNLTGLQILAHMPSESGNTFNDPSSILVSAFPSRAVSITANDYPVKLINTNVLDVFLSEKAYRAPTGVEYGEGTGWLFSSFWKQDMYQGTAFYTQQGPLTQQSQGTLTENAMKGRPSEFSVLFENNDTAVALKTMMTTYLGEHSAELLYNTMYENTWGTTASSDSAVCSSGGDRFNLVDAVTCTKIAQQSGLQAFLDYYAKKGIYPDNIYEVLCYCRQMHWAPNIYSCSLPAYGWSKEDAWILMAKAVSSEQVITCIKSHVDTYLQSQKGQTVNNYSYAGQGGYAGNSAMMEECIAIIEDLNLSYSDGSKFDIWADTTNNGYGYKGHQAVSTYIYYMFDYIMLETLYSEGGTSE